MNDQEWEEKLDRLNDIRTAERLAAKDLRSAARELLERGNLTAARSHIDAALGRMAHAAALKSGR